VNDDGIQVVRMFPAFAHDIENEFADNQGAMCPNVRSFGKWMYRKVGFAYETKVFVGECNS
jgi:hypothetical protein